jgi:hypothetical protein
MCSLCVLAKDTSIIHPHPPTPPHTHAHVPRAFEWESWERAMSEPSVSDKDKRKARDRLAQLFRRQASGPLAEVGGWVGGWVLCDMYMYQAELMQAHWCPTPPTLNTPPPLWAP